MKIILYSIVALLVLSIGCTKMDDYKRFTDGKEISYSGRADSLKAFPGKNRIKLTWQITSDPRINKASIYWANNSDSLILPIIRKPGVEYFSVIIPKLVEATYSFKVLLHDNKGNTSVPVYVTSKAYGKNYEESLLNRSLQTITKNSNGSALLTWGVFESTALGVEVNYVTPANAKKQIYVKGSLATNTISDIMSKSTVSYRTYFKPDTLSIDTFYAPVLQKTLTF